MAITVRTVTTFPLDDAQRDFNINFDYLARKFVQVAVIDSTLSKPRKELVLGTDFRFTTKTSLNTTIAWGPNDGYDRIEIRRVTSTTERVVDFADGSILRATDLNASQVQAIHIAEEARDAALLAMPQDDQGNLDARNRRIVRLADGIDQLDAVNKKQLDTTLGEAGGILSDIKDLEKDIQDYILNFTDNTAAVRGVSWVYNEGSANGGETSIVITREGPVLGVPYVEINGDRQYRDYHFTYNVGTKTITLVEPLKAGDFVVAITTEGTIPLVDLLGSASGASTVGKKGGGTVQDVIDAPFIITGTVNIKNPYWNAPQDNAEDPAAAASNVAAMNRMLSSGAKHVEFDDKSRRVNTTLYYVDSVAIHGMGRSSKSLVWIGGDAPIIARPTYGNKDVRGASNVRIQDLGIVDQAASRVSYYSVDLFNGNSNGMERCWIDSPGRFNADGSRIVTSDRYGVALGVARNSTLPGNAGFVSHFRDSRITNGTLMINGTDWYVTGSELWGSFRNRAVEISGGGTIDGGTQIVPGAEAGIFLFSDVGFDIDTLKLIGVYFDGSTDKTLFTGWGVKSAAGIGLVSAEVLGCDFWHINQGGVYVSKIQSSTIESNFRDCDSDDTGEDDIRCDDVSGSRIVNRHYRSTAPKTDAPRVNLGRPFNITGHVGFPISTVGGEVTYVSGYNRCRVINTDVVRSVGGSFLTSFVYTSLPPAAGRVGEVVLVSNRAYYSDGTNWRDVSGYTGSLETPTDLRALSELPSYYTSDITKHTNVPTGAGGAKLTGAATIEVFNISPSYRVLKLTILKASGGVYTSVLSGGVWSDWSKTA